MRCPRCVPDGLVHKVWVAANVDLMTEPLGDASKRLCQEGFMYRRPQLTAIQQPLLPSSPAERKRSRVPRGNMHMRDTSFVIPVPASDSRCTSLDAHLSLSSAAISGQCCKGQPRARATALAVTSSCVGPMPPMVMIAPHLAPKSWTARAMRSSSSGRISTSSTRIPCPRRYRHACPVLMSCTFALSTSLPIVIRPTVNLRMPSPASPAVPDS